MKFKCIVFTFFLISISSYSQDLVWTGDQDTNFFNELNWKINNTTNSPEAGTINNNVAIDLELSIADANQLIIADGIVNLGSGSLSISTSELKANAISGGTLTINEAGYLDLENIDPLLGTINIELNSGIGWVRAKKLAGATIVSDHINQIKVAQQVAVYKTNLRLDNYYLNGTVIRSNALATAPLTIYDATSLSGSSTTISVDVIHTGASISNNMNNKTNSFLLKKGFMATIADEEDGTGKSKNYIALEEDLIVNELPAYLQNNISFLRVMPWNWVSKKGIGGTETGLDNTWFYKWNNTGTSTLDKEYGPMAWGGNAANDDADIALYKSKYKATHVLAFNESDHCTGQSGQYNNLCQTDVAVGLYKNLMKTGLRLVSPSGREGAPFGWLKEFNEKAIAQDIRIDVIGVHWYDWGSNPQSNQNPSATQVFNRFKTHLKNIHDLYNLPIWITEFNANPNRSNAINLAFMKLALPYLESLDYIERYAWFQPNATTGAITDPGTADFYEADGTTLTNVGLYYKGEVSTPAIPENTITADNNLDIYYRENGFQLNNLLENGNFETGDLTGWNGATTIDVLKGTGVYEGETSGRIKAGEGNIYQQVSLDASSTYDLSFYARWFVAPAEAIEIQILNATNDDVIASKMMTAEINWNLIELSFEIPENVTSIKMYAEKGAGSPGWFIDYAFLEKTGTVLNIDNFDTESPFKIYPNPSKGIVKIESLANIDSYILYDVQGKVIQQEKNINQLKKELHILQSGMYFLKINDISAGSSLKKIMIH